jgi:hypothetical protein
MARWRSHLTLRVFWKAAMQAMALNKAMVQQLRRSCLRTTRDIYMNQHLRTDCLSLKPSCRGGSKRGSAIHRIHVRIIAAARKLVVAASARQIVIHLCASRIVRSSESYLMRLHDHSLIYLKVMRQHFVVETARVVKSNVL